MNLKTVTQAMALVVGSAAMTYSLTRQGAPETESVEADPEPLYWVAPMDPNYRRDKPGKSPMGMDLVPVYAEERREDTPGTIRISPEVINNLGVRLARVERGSLDAVVNTVGYVQYDEDRLIHIHPRVEGWIERLSVKAAGDPVQSGEPLYALYSPTLVSAQEELLLALKRNNPALVSAAMDRLRALQVPEAELERLQREGEVSQTIVMRAPQSGVVDDLHVREGMFVKPGMEMMSIGQLESVWVIGELFESQVAQVAAGDTVRMSLDYLPGRVWLGAVDYVYPSVSTDNRTARVRVRLANSDGFLKPGMFTQMVIQPQRSSQALVIPREALIRTGQQSRVVLALGDGRFKSVAVEAGQIVGDRVEVISGLTAGDQIVSSAQFLIDSESSKTSDFRRMSSPSGSAAVDHSAMDHGSMDHTAMDHGAMDHSEHASMDHSEHSAVDHSTMNHSPGEENLSATVKVPDSVWVSASVVGVNSEQRLLTLRHEPIAAWDWPEMTMDFDVAEDVDLDGLLPGMALHVQISRSEQTTMISVIHRRHPSQRG